MQSSRIVMGVEYDGTNFHGWQTQVAGVRSVQTVLQRALSQVADQQIIIQCAGRTDTGVHALEQIIHFDTTAIRSDRAWVLGCNSALPSDIAVHWTQPVASTFHARFSALARHYRYELLMQHTRAPLQRQRAVWIHRELNLMWMQEAAQALVGEHDFSSFRAAACQAKSPIRRVNYFNIVKQNNYLIFTVGANGFLHHMVRNFIGGLIKIGRGEVPVTWMQTLLAARDRRLGGMTAPAQGLYFVRADYPNEFKLPQIKFN